MTGYDAVLLAGGRARRLGGVAKPAVRVGGRTLIDRVAAAVPRAERLVVVGPGRPAPPGAVVVRERPAGSGPVPALRAAMPEVRGERMALLAADLPFFTEKTLNLLLAALAGPASGGESAGHPAGAVLVDETGHPQWLAGVWRTGVLRAALHGYLGGSLRGVLAPLGPVRVAVPATAAAPWLDCDTADQLAEARRLAIGRDLSDSNRPPVGDVLRDR